MRRFTRGKGDSPAKPYGTKSSGIKERDADRRKLVEAIKKILSRSALSAEGERDLAAILATLAARENKDEFLAFHSKDLEESDLLQAEANGGVILPAAIFGELDILGQLFSLGAVDVATTLLRHADRTPDLYVTPKPSKGTTVVSVDSTYLRLIQALIYQLRLDAGARKHEAVLWQMIDLIRTSDNPLVQAQVKAAWQCPHFRQQALQQIIASIQGAMAPSTVAEEGLAQTQQLLGLIGSGKEGFVDLAQHFLMASVDDATQPPIEQGMVVLFKQLMEEHSSGSDLAPHRIACLTAVINFIRGDEKTPERAAYATAFQPVVKSITDMISQAMSVGIQAMIEGRDISVMETWMALFRLLPERGRHDQAAVQRGALSKRDVVVRVKKAGEADPLYEVVEAYDEVTYPSWLHYLWVLEDNDWNKVDAGFLESLIRCGAPFDPKKDFDMVNSLIGNLKAAAERGIGVPLTDKLMRVFGALGLPGIQSVNVLATVLAYQHYQSKGQTCNLLFDVFLHAISVQHSEASAVLLRTEFAASHFIPTLVAKQAAASESWLISTKDVVWLMVALSKHEDVLLKVLTALNGGSRLPEVYAHIAETANVDAFLALTRFSIKANTARPGIGTLPITVAAGARVQEHIAEQRLSMLKKTNTTEEALNDLMLSMLTQHPQCMDHYSSGATGGGDRGSMLVAESQMRERAGTLTSPEASAYGDGLGHSPLEVVENYYTDDAGTVASILQAIRGEQWIRLGMCLSSFNPSSAGEIDQIAEALVAAGQDQSDHMATLDDLRASVSVFQRQESLRGSLKAKGQVARESTVDPDELAIAYNDSHVNPELKALDYYHGVIDDWDAFDRQLQASPNQYAIHVYQGVTFLSIYTTDGVVSHVNLDEHSTFNFTLMPSAEEGKFDVVPTRRASQHTWQDCLAANAKIFAKLAPLNRGEEVYDAAGVDVMPVQPLYSVPHDPARGHDRKLSVGGSGQSVFGSRVKQLQAELQSTLGGDHSGPTGTPGFDNSTI